MSDNEAPYRVVGEKDDFNMWPVTAYYIADDKKRVAVAQIDDTLYAFDDLCTMHKCSLSSGLLKPDVGQIMCQCGGCHFDVRTGKVVEGPATEPLKPYPVRFREGAVGVQV